MPKQFPGMDPYLEGYLWPDVHQSLSYLISAQLTPQLGDSYLVQLHTYTVMDRAPQEDIGILYPDVELLKRAEEPQEVYGNPFTPATLCLPDVEPIEVRIPVVEIRDRKGNELITAIELLSPVNKRYPGLAAYRSKRERLRVDGVHFIEIDLLRRGTRTLTHPDLPAAHYLIALNRAGQPQTDIWALGLRDVLPVIPVPLRPPDADLPLDLGQTLDRLYRERTIDKSIDYQQPPPPPALTEKEWEWVQSLFENQKKL